MLKKLQDFGAQVTLGTMNKEDQNTLGKQKKLILKEKDRMKNVRKGTRVKLNMSRILKQQRTLKDRRGFSICSELAETKKSKYHHQYR